MKESFVVAKCFDFKTIRLIIFSNAQKDDMDFVLLKDEYFFEKLKLIRQSSLHGIAFYEFALKNNIELGHRYNIVLPNFGSVALDVNDLAALNEFDNYYGYDGDDLGANYTPESTSFVVWAPLASKVLLHYEINGKVTILEMKREQGGVYRLLVEGNLDGAVYTYLVTNSGDTYNCVDPYAKGSTANGLQSVVINFNKIKRNMYDDKLPILNSYCDAIIYEGHVRDLTISSSTDIMNKGKFLGLCEENRHTKAGHPAGLDYLKMLGFTHLQLLPVMDYVTVDENNPNNSYNWGYDPQQYFNLEGSYSSDPNDPYSRIVEFTQLVSTFHKNGIRINMDVVYNHVYRYQFSNFEKIVPNYFFRHRDNGKVENHSGCGSDFATERRMARKLIVDSCTFFVKQYDIDGFRFDLMGLIDVDTLKLVEESCRLVKKDLMFYGEGWNMMRLPNHLMGNMDNAASLRHFAFFNDRFRELVKGGSGDHIREHGYGLNNADFKEGFKFAYAACCVDFIYPKLFIAPTQSLNYVECHDNETLYDKLLQAIPNDTVDIRLKRIKLINSIVMFSLGIPFFHAGQEIGLSKKKHDNTYNDNSGINTFSYDVLDSRFEMALYFSQLTKMRKETPSICISETRFINSTIDIKNFDESGLVVEYINKARIKPYSSLKLLINPSLKTYYYDFNEDQTVLFNICGNVSSANVQIKNLMMSPLSVIILFTK